MNSQISPMSMLLLLLLLVQDSFSQDGMETTPAMVETGGNSMDRFGEYIINAFPQVQPGLEFYHVLNVQG